MSSLLPVAVAALIVVSHFFAVAVERERKRRELSFAVASHLCQETLVIEEIVREGDASKSRVQATRRSVTTTARSEESEETVETET
ncbi:hypothetical protein LWI28_021258 [Acer negundo]|uniref:Secreted protein n=1 Tax=Acer negundo TaxID=4023 RepID=A0AAD5NKA2_ACENE|nr:hypothetical protein LWI28_021258 [Acer negundo]